MLLSSTGLVLDQFMRKFVAVEVFQLRCGNHESLVAAMQSYGTDPEPQILLHDTDGPNVINASAYFFFFSPVPIVKSNPLSTQLTANTARMLIATIAGFR